MKTHGLHDSLEYRSWNSMNERCHNPNSTGYERYGGRGIRVCDAWRYTNGFAAFIAHVGKRPTPKHTLDRINNNGNYEPGNVRWATRKEQGNNRRTNRLLTHKGLSRTLAEWADAIGLDPSSLHERLASGWSMADALETPPNESHDSSNAIMVNHNGKTKSASAWASEYGIGRNVVLSRLRKGMSLEEILSTPIKKNLPRLLTHNGRTLTVAEWSRQTGIKYSAIKERLRRGWSDSDAITKPIQNTGMETS